MFLLSLVLCGAPGELQRVGSSGKESVEGRIIIMEVEIALWRFQRQGEGEGEGGGGGRKRYPKSGAVTSFVFSMRREKGNNGRFQFCVSASRRC